MVTAIRFVLVLLLLTSIGPEEVRVEFEDAVAIRGVEGPSQTVLTCEPDWRRSCVRLGHAPRARNLVVTPTR